VCSGISSVGLINIIKLIAMCYKQLTRNNPLEETREMEIIAAVVVVQWLVITAKLDCCLS